MKLHAFLKLFFPMIPVSYQRNMLLNSHEPAITQLSRMCLSATVSQYVRHNRITALILNYRDEGAADYIWSHYAYAMAHFLEHKVKRHEYCHDVSFWCNVLSSVRSVHNMVDSKYKRRYGCGLSSLNDTVETDSGRIERVHLLTSKDRMVPRSGGYTRACDADLMTVLEDAEELQCGFYN